MNTKHYHDTTDESAAVVKKETEKCISQEEKVKSIFKKEGKMTASMVLSHFPSNVPLTSIRRAMSNLQRQDIINITDEKKEGLYGKPEKFYKLS